MNIHHIPRRAAAVALALAAVALVGPAAAEGTLIPAPQRVDMVHDDSRGLVYITQGGEVLRYHVASGAFLPPIAIGGALVGLDISADNATLAVADDVSDSASAWVHLVALDDLNVSKRAFAKQSTYEGGTFSVRYGADGRLYTSNDFWGSGTVGLRRLDPATGAWTSLASLNQATMLAPSGDGQTMAFAESNASDGPWGLIDLPTGGIVRRRGYTDGTTWYNYEIGVDRLGSQFAIPTFGGTFVYDAAYRKVATLGQYAGPQPVGVAYHPVERIAYFPWSGSSEVRVYDMDTFAPIGSHDAKDTFSGNGNRAFVQGRTRLSRDGSLLMVSVTGGVRLLQTYAPLSAAPLSISAVAGTPVSVALPGSIGNGGALAYEIVRAPRHGALTLSGAVATYVAEAGFGGTDDFRYRVRYGSAVREAEARITVVVPNRPPLAADDSAATRRTAILIPVLANDRDPDGDPLSIVAVTAPRVGRVAIESGMIRYTPPRSWSGSVGFVYTVSDGRGGTASATVTVTRN